MKKILNLGLILLAILFGAISFWDSTSASQDKVNTLILKAEKSPEAKAQVAEFLAEHPHPTNGKMHDIDVKVDEVLIENQSRTSNVQQTVKNDAQTQKPYMTIFGMPYTESEAFRYITVMFFAFVALFLIPLYKYKA